MTAQQKRAANLYAIFVSINTAKPVRHHPGFCYTRHYLSRRL
jgi:hypothetical protein